MSTHLHTPVAENSHARGVRIAAAGIDLPPQVIPTAEVEERAHLRELGFESGWLERVTGVRERRWADPATQPSDLAAAAGRHALEKAGVDPDDITNCFAPPVTDASFKASMLNK